MKTTSLVSVLPFLATAQATGMVSVASIVSMILPMQYSVLTIICSGGAVMSAILHLTPLTTSVQKNSRQASLGTVSTSVTSPRTVAWTSLVSPAAAALVGYAPGRST